MTHRRNKTRGFTLTEVLVGLVLLSGMALIVSQVLSQASQVVTLSEEKIRQNSAAAALGEAIRDTLRKASSNGVLCIGRDSAGDARLFVTQAGITSSVTGNARGTGGFTLLGLVDNSAPGSSGRLLFMPGYVLAPLGGTGTDVRILDFATLQSCTRRQANDFINPYYNPPPPLSTPSNNAADISALWQVAATGITRLSIQWTDGTTSGGNLKWFGPEFDGTVVPLAQNSAWNTPSRAADKLDDAANFSFPEYHDGSNRYRAIWTHHNQNNWPKAIRIRFTLMSKDPAMRPEFRNTDYDVIGTVGQ